MRALSEHSAQEERADYKVDTTKKYTYQDYLKLPEEPGYRYEVLEGVLVKDPSPNVMHQRVSRRLIRVLEDYLVITIYTPLALTPDILEKGRKIIMFKG